MNVTKPTVSIDWLKTNLDHPNLILLDASLPKPMAKAEDNPLAGIQIPGTLFFDIDHSFSDSSVNLPHTMLPDEDFNREARKLGINNESILVVYDNLGVYSSPRVWWMFRAMGHEEVAVLDGGLPEWVSAGFSTEAKGKRQVSEGDFTGNRQSGFFRNAEEVLRFQSNGDTLTLDARSRGRFEGTEPEPRPGLRGGHIPNSVCLPFSEVVAGNKMKNSLELKKQFDELGVKHQDLVFSCGSGLTACIIALAAQIAGYDKLSVYDGSWSEWGQPGDLPVSTGAV
ncbi:MAG: sulfurtransferase [Cyclobacteriaceae bacterium]